MQVSSFIFTVTNGIFKRDNSEINAGAAFSSMESLKGFQTDLFGLPSNWWHRCWWRMLETKCVGDNYKRLVTVLALLITNIHCHRFTLASPTPLSSFLFTGRILSVEGDERKHQLENRPWPFVTKRNFASFSMISDWKSFKYDDKTINGCSRRRFSKFFGL